MRFLLYAAALLVMIAGDQALKGWTVSHLELGESTPFIPAIMQLTRVHNYGAAWSSLSGKTVLLIAVTAVMMIAVAVLLLRRVVDMFDLLLFSYPVFNLADCFVVVGAILGAVYYLWIYEKFDARKKSNDSPSDSHN